MFQSFLLEGVTLGGLSQCTFARWQPRIGDPHLMGWVTVVCYALTFLLCVAVFKKTDPTRRAARMFWFLLCVLMLFLAVNKQLDLQSFATAGARCIAKLQGWYADRGSFQFKVVLGMGLAAMVISLIFLWALRRDLKRNLVALIGLAVVFGFVLIRAVGWHDFDAIINIRLGVVRLNWVLELSGLFLISINAIFLLKSSRIDRPRRRRRRTVQNPVYRRKP